MKPPPMELIFKGTDAAGDEEGKGKHPKAISRVNNIFAINVCQMLTLGSQKYQG